MLVNVPTTLTALAVVPYAFAVVPFETTNIIKSSKSAPEENRCAPSRTKFKAWPALFWEERQASAEQFRLQLSSPGVNHVCGPLAFSQ